MNILTFDLEDWFHTFDKPYYNNPKLWKTLPSAIESDVSRICDILDETNTKATFFTLGWVVKYHPLVIKKITDKGHELGLHSYFHRKVNSLSSKAFKEDLKKNIWILEDKTGRKLNSFRAPGFSLKEAEQWALETLLELDINIDSSLFPCDRFNNIDNLPDKPFRLVINGQELFEFPQIKVDIFNFPFFYLSSGYFRLTPVRFIKKALTNMSYTMCYYHPRDFNTETHKLFSNPYLKLKYRIGTKGAERKLAQISKGAEFISIGEAHRTINWSETPVFDL